MTDYDAEIGRGARPNAGGGAFGVRRPLRPLEEYAALEYPRESSNWLLRTAEAAHAPPPDPREKQVRENESRPVVGPRGGRSTA